MQATLRFALFGASFLALAGVAHRAEAQSPDPADKPPPQPRLRCGTPDPDLAAMPRGAGVQADCDLFSTSPTDQYAPTTVTYRIPVVVHVIQSTSGAGYISPQEVREQIEILNGDFLAIPGTLGAPSVNSQIEFYLATTDPAGNPTDGIKYYVNNAWFVDQGPGSNCTYCQSTAWDPHNYLNIYTVNIAGDSILGFVPGFPAQGNLVGTSSDRVVIRYSAFGPNGIPPNHLGRTLTHEVGHYLGLFHTFHDSSSCPSAATPQCYENGDLICDTPVEQFAHFGCLPSSSCGSEDDISNHMDYSDDVCLTHFSAEQVRRMRCTLENWRPDLFEVDTSSGFMTVSPAGTVVHSGLTGGPFTNAPRTYTLSNVGQAPIDYRVSLSTPFGILINNQVTPLTGTLNSGASLAVEVTLGPDVTALAPGTYTDTIVFEDLSNNTTLIRQHTVEVGRLSVCADLQQPLFIPDGALSGISHSLTFTEEATTTDVNVSLSINHTWIGDLVVDLTHVDSGTTVRLVDRIGSSQTLFGCAGESMLVTLDDQGTGGPIENACSFAISSPPSYVPDGSLGGLGGLSVAGEWRIKLTDAALGDSGTLNGWCISMGAVANVAPPPPADADGDGIADSIDNCPSIPNPNQADANGNGVGTACDATESVALTLSDCPADLSVPATSAQGADVTFDLPQAAGGFGAFTVIANPPSGSRFAIGETTVTVSAFDSSNQSSQCTFKVTVTTGSGPVVQTPPTTTGDCCGGGATTAVMPLAVFAAGLLWRRRRARSIASR